MSRGQRISRQGKRKIINRHPSSNSIQLNNIAKLPESNSSNEKINIVINPKIKQYFDQLLQSSINKGDDDNLPFLKPLPKTNIFNISDLAKDKNVEVLNAFRNVNIARLSEEYDLVTILPFRGRYLHLEKTLNSLIQSSERSDLKIGFIVIENSNSPIFNKELFSDNKKFHYVWLNSNGNIFNKCICHNIGAAISNSTFVHFHDCDLLVPSNFYSALLDELNKNPAVQAFSGRKVNYLDENSTKKYFDNLDLESIIEDTRNFREGVFGAPGGSVALSRDLFLRVGGFDAHFFWGYSIEDKFFWDKVEKLNHITSLENPKIDLYHLWHPPGWGKNPYERFEQRIYQLFALCRPGSEHYLKIAKELYNITMEKLVNNGE
jgi:hypothetical protein